MALATQCPHCQTIFRVAHDQLKLRAGLVRCGSCKQIFNGIENLLRLDEDGQPNATPPAPSPSSAAPATGAAPNTETDIAALLQGGPSGAPQANAAEQPPEAEEQKPENPMLRMTLLDFAHVPRQASTDTQPGGNPEPAAEAGTAPAPAVEQEDPVEQAINDLQNKPWRNADEAEQAPDADPLDQADAADYEEPAFVRQARRRQRLGQAARSVFGAGSAFLLLAFLLQASIAFRDQIAARFPAARPALSAACGLLGCQVGLPAQIDSVSIESSELQAESSDSNRFALTVLLRNQGSTVEAWPYIELTLNDAHEKPLLRRVFVPRDYLPAAQDAAGGFAARSEQPVKLYFELAQVQASGYRVYVFYP
ncbi:MAG TPA: DUF3426 domain-containing protein [Noviherbaspirillum sp.]|jgi:predicted Zn finger-like uncharacterized protein|uniref:DUF3426 domain-containing protein n=1 Tax=Noviherbaspirillum sp. TaxID=1926288 RepID=UPI002F9380E2